MSNQFTEDQVMLKTSMLGGFNKKEVLSYVDRLHEENQASMANLKIQLKEMTSARTSLEENVFSFQKTISDLERNLSDKNAKIGELAGEIALLKVDGEMYSKSTSDADKALIIQKEQNNILALKIQNFDNISHKYEEMSAHITSILLEADKSATSTRKTAEEDAIRIKSNVFAATQKATNDLCDLKIDINGIRKSIENMVFGLTERLDGITSSIDTVLNEAPALAAKSSHLLENKTNDYSKVAPKSSTEGLPVKVDLCPKTRIRLDDELSVNESSEVLPSKVDLYPKTRMRLDDELSVNESSEALPPKDDLYLNTRMRVSDELPELSPKEPEEVFSTKVHSSPNFTVSLEDEFSEFLVKKPSPPLETRDGSFDAQDKVPLFFRPATKTTD